MILVTIAEAIVIPISANDHLVALIPWMFDNDFPTLMVDEHWSVPKRKSDPYPERYARVCHCRLRSKNISTNQDQSYYKYLFHITSK
jgi:hypothetical protein